MADTVTEFRNTLKQAFMFNNRDVSQYISGDYFISESELYELREDFNLEPCHNDSIYWQMKSELADFDMLSRYAVHGNKLLNGRNDIYNVVVEEKNVEEVKVNPENKYTRLVLAEIGENLSIVDVSVQFDVQSFDTMRQLPQLVVSMGDFYHAVDICSTTGLPLNTGEKECFRTNVVVPLSENEKGMAMKVYLWNREKILAICSDVRINILGYNPTIKNIRK